MHNHLSDQDKIDAIAAYRNKVKVKDIAKQYGVTETAIYALFRRRKVQLQDISVAHRKYDINQHYFDVIDTEDKAYFLGFLFADGYNNRSRHMVNLGLHEQDKAILDTFINKLETNRPLLFVRLSHKYKNTSNQYRLSISNMHMSAQLEKLGCVQAKAHVLRFPSEDIVPHDLVRHFVRGYFDGDGNFTAYIPTGRHNKNYTLTILSALEFCQSLQQVVLEHAGIQPIKLSKRFQTTVYVTCGKNAFRFMDWIYKDANYYLERKYAKYLQERASITL